MSTAGEIAEAGSPLQSIADVTSGIDWTDTPDGLRGALSKSERAALTACEAAIEEHIGAWVNVTNALAQIHTGRLYRETHSTFEAYVRDRWGLSRSQGHRLTLAAKVGMSPVGDRIRNERQAREIATLLDDPDQLVAVVDRAAEMRDGKPITAAALRQARAELLAKPEDQQTLQAAWRWDEMTNEIAAEGERRRQRLANDLLAMPPELWTLHFGRWVRHNGIAKNGTDAARRHVERLVLDAELTPEVVEVIRLALETGLLPSIGSAFTLAEQASRVLGDLHDGMQRAIATARSSVAASGDTPDPFGEHLAQIGHALAGMSRHGADITARRMAEVITVCATDPRPLRQEWTPAEVDAERKRIRSADPGAVRHYIPGPVGQLQAAAPNVLRELQELGQAMLDQLAIQGQEVRNALPTRSTSSPG